MVKLRFRITIAVVSITLLVMTSLVVTIGQLYENFTLNSITDRLKKEAQLTAYILAEEGLDRDNIQLLTEQFSETLNARVTIILPDGTVIGESDTDPSLMDNHDSRPEIKAVTSGEEGMSIRYSNTVNEELLYYAVPVIDAQNQEIGYVRLGLPTTTLTQMNQTIWGILIISFSIAFVIIGSVTYRVANQMIRPIENATAVAIELAEGNFKARTVEGKSDEIGQLTKSINVLAYNLEQITRRHQAQQERMETLIENMGSGLILINRRGDITLINRTCNDIFQDDTDLWVNQLYHDVIKHKELNKIVQTIFLTEEKQRMQIHFPVHLEVRHFDVYAAPIMSNKGRLKGIAIVLHDITELKKLEQVRKDFVANVSHELKTPVTSIKGFTETLLDGAMETEQLRGKFLNIIYKESERLQGLIHDLLELSRIEQQYFKLNWQKTNLEGIVEDVAVLLKEKAKEKGIEIVTKKEGDSTLEGDPERLKQILINLVNNGIMYTSSGGRIDILLTGTKDLVELQIADTGVGISEEDLPRIFERFYRVDRARSRNSGGTGLGLAIVKHLVEAHHGHIHVQSQVGKGTTFTVVFKRQQDEGTEK
ncbi:two-component system histidine kinase PnpS [Halalkalibacter nanhaiisediminis]|uniref:histidine kinase n=1 Tax=Halalkalibacter nanhaiisediminis TaxID=688079 RepID=A0A562QJT1_9BACI|nr:ATP-binding protein [Halalkalibacter nanhaiisediminis]TWI56994.1 two-component system phosphate regulon sensor histidine kinase PhoR [Halalkalibacter nanhaiisediminis]